MTTDQKNGIQAPHFQQTHTGKKDLYQRVHECLDCGYKTDRDLAAAQVVMQRGTTAVGHIAVNFGEGK